MQLADGLWVLGNYFFNLYLLQGEQGSALVEAGISAVVDDVISQLEALKISPTFLVVTHPHADHVTGLPGLKARYPQLLVVTGEGSPEFLSHPKAEAALVREDRHMAMFLESQGIQPGRPPLNESPTFENCLVAADGDEMDLGDITLRYLAVGGHSPGTIIAHVPEMNALMLSDSLGFRYPGRGIFPLFLTGYPDYMESLEKLQKLNPSIVGPAHQGPVVGKDVDQAFAKALGEAMTLRDQILNDARPAEQISQEVFQRYYRDECKMYTPENIMNCAKLLVKRARE